MKKILFCAGLLAFVTSCTQDELLNDSVAVQTNGISFSASVPDMESRGTLYENNDKFPFFWHAEKDQINVLAKGDVTGTGKVITVTDGAWTIPTVAVYKATKSEGNGQFTSLDEDNLLEFNTVSQGNPKAKFVAAYGADIKTVNQDDNGKITNLTIAVELSNAEQTLTSKNVADYAPMYSVSEGEQEESYESVGENVNLSFYRPLAVAGFRATGIKDYVDSELFGNLKSITVTTKGFKVGDEQLIPASNIAYAANDVVTIDLANPTDPSKTNVTSTAATKNEVKAIYNTVWDGSEVLFMALANVDRSAYKTETMVAKNATESITIKYEFDYITFTDVKPATTSDWVSNENSVIPMPKLDMANFPYFVVEKGATKALIVNSGTFASVMKNATQVNWGEGIDASAITELYCHVDLTSEEQALLQKFTGLKVIELSVETSLVKDALKGLYDTLEEINMPLVTTIAEDFVDDNFSTLTTLNLGSYAFDNKTINDYFFTEDKVVTLDASGVSTMEPVFGTEAALSFRGLGNLETIKVNNMALYSNSFNGCTGLKKVDGIVDITNAEYAFAGCENLKSVKISGTVIPRNAFDGCKELTTVLNGTAQVVPTTIGEEAFKDTEKLEVMDLANATTIGKNAFNNSGLRYSSYTDEDTYNEVVTVGAAKIEEGAFANTKLVYVNFKNATEVAPGFLTGVTTLKHIKFEKAFTVVVPTTNTWAGSFGNANTVTLFVDAEQAYIVGSSLELPYGEDGLTAPISFGIIKK